jgi:hypothetical protein
MNDDYIEEIRVIDVAQEFSVLAKANIGKQFTRKNEIMAFTVEGKKLTVAINGQNIKWTELEELLEQFEAGEWKEI